MRRRARIAPFGIVALAVLLFLGWMRLYGLGLNFYPEDMRWQTQPEESKASPWKREGNDMGMVLLDIPTRQAALAFHVPVPGVYVLSVTKNSPADLAGVMPGDHIAGVNGISIDEAAELTAALGSPKAGETVELTILRGRERLTLTLQAEAIACKCPCFFIYWGQGGGLHENTGSG